MHGHAHGPTAPLTAEQEAQRGRALRILIWVLVPLAIWTAIGLYWLWPDGDKLTLDNLGVTAVNATSHQGTIEAIAKTDCSGQNGSYAGDKSICAQLTVLLTDGPEQGTKVQVSLNGPQFRSGASVGEKVVLYRLPLEGQAQPAYQFHDYVRTIPLLVFGLVFAAAVVIVARLRGLLSLVGLGFAFFILSAFMMPALLEGRDPLLVGVVGSAAIMFVVLYCAHGFTLRTTTALVGTLFGLGLTAGLGVLGTKWAHLTGVGSEDDLVLAASAPQMQLTAVVICGIIVASLGALNDVTITQASAVWELADSRDSRRDLFRSAMRIGRDHIASTVYTIAFAAAGAALPMLLLLSIYQRPVMETLTGEVFGSEFIRTAIGSIGLVLAVPVTTLVGVAAVSLGRRASSEAPARAVSARPVPAHGSAASTGSVASALSTASAARRLTPEGPRRSASEPPRTPAADTAPAPRRSATTAASAATAVPPPPRDEDHAAPRRGQRDDSAYRRPTD